MLFSSLLWAASLAVHATLAHSPKPASGNEHAVDALLQKRQRAGPIITSGANGLGDGRIHSRLEVSDLANRPDQFSLLVHAMARWEKVAQSDFTGYFGVSSIHGVPRTSWDGVEQCDTCDGADGYCTHNSVHFPSWHRSYLALFEQEFLKVALEVAQSFSGDFGARMVAEAQTLRFPYWDWAADPDNGGDVLPPILTSKRITIAGPNGQETLDNPLYSYTFADNSGLYYSPFTVWDTTLRWPTSNAKSATSQDQKVITAFNQLRENLQDQVYGLLTNCDNYLHFATDDSSSSSPKCQNSLEGIHNTVHTTGGGAGSSTVSGGHLTYLPLSSYDKLFWFHHFNVERLSCLWQTIHPEVYGASQTAPHATWVIASGSMQDANSPLRPFRKDANNFWTTNDVRDWSNTFKYTYPEFASTDGSRAAIINLVNGLYGPNANITATGVSSMVERNDRAPSRVSSTSSIAARDRAPTAQTGNSAANPPSGSGIGFGLGIGPLSLSLNLPFGSAPPAGPSKTSPVSPSAWNATITSKLPSPTGTGVADSDPRFFAPNGSEYQYQCNVHTPRYAFNGSYTVYVFDGQPSTNDTESWLGDDNCIGVIGILAGGEMTGMDIISTGSVPVTRHLQKQCKAGKLQDLTGESVTPYMTKNLNWKILYAGEEVHPDSLSGFKSSFWSGSSTPAGPGTLPTWSDLTPHIDVTKGKAGGVQQLADALGNTVQNGVGGVATGYGSPSESSPAAVTQPYGSPAVSPAPSAPASQEEEDTVTVYVTEYETVCPCKPTSTSAPAAPTYSV